MVGTDLIVQTTFDWRHALQLGCVESVSPHYVTQPGPLSVTLNWDFTEEDDEDVADERVSFAKASKRERGPAMSVPAVRGSPYATMEYRGASPLILARQVGDMVRCATECSPLCPSCHRDSSARMEP